MTQAFVPVSLPLKEISKTLKKVWGFDSLRPLQQEVVEAALNNRDAVVVMPTGGGKSLCFQLPAIYTKELTVVISPLIALMKDQVDALTVVGVEAASLNSSMSPDEERNIHQRLENGQLNILYMSPERLLQSTTQQLLTKANGGKGVARFAIDEAHCISAWGHDFRPEFRQLKRIKQMFPGVPVQAFTATATPKVQRDIAIQLNLERPKKFVGVFDRPNLTYRVVAKDDAVRRTIEAVKRYPYEGVIVYCLSRKDTDSIAAALVKSGIPAVAYHAGLSNEIRKKVSEDFAGERANIVVATIAFGMGIDRANVRCVIHECLPKSMEGYQQETGRAGRDGLPSECVLLYSHSDVVRLKRLLEGGPPEVTNHHYHLLEEVRRFATSHQCRHKSLSEHFGQEYDGKEVGCGACDVCLGGMKALDNSKDIGLQILRTASGLMKKGRSFGVSYLVSVLLGARIKLVLERGGDTADGFGAFASENKNRVAAWVHQMMDIGLLEVTEGQYPVVQMTTLGNSVLSDGGNIDLVENVALLSGSKPSKSRLPDGADENLDEGLFQELRAWRREKATSLGVPAYVIFHDATLMKIATVRPTSVAGLGSISGVGQRQVESYGLELMELIDRLEDEIGFSRDQELSSQKPVTVLKGKTSSFAEYFVQGSPIEEIAEKFNLSEKTVSTYLCNWIEVEKPKSIRAWVDTDTEAKVRKALAADDSEALKPIFEALNGDIPYEEIRIVKSLVQSQS